MSVWIRHVQTDSHHKTEFYENVSRRGSPAAGPTPADQLLEIDGAPLDLAVIELVVVDLPLSGDAACASARIYDDLASVQPVRVLSGSAARDLRQALAGRTLTPDP